MKQVVFLFSELATEHKQGAGGKGGTLAQLYQRGMPVPGGFVVMPAAFKNDELLPEARAQVLACLEQIRNGGGGIAFAVRSSALCEDSSTASFAGQFETILDVRTDQEVFEAIQTVRNSRHSEEVRVYSQVKGIDDAHDLAVVVQEMVQADISGVLFTADPVSGNRDQMTGNFVFGLGEKLVSGQAKAFSFTLRPANFFRKSGYEGPPELKKFAGKIYNLGKQLEKELGCPQDIEWSIAGGQLYLLQSRPITTLSGYNPETGDWNSSKTGDYLWSNVNFGEAIPQAMTPFSWTVQRFISKSWSIMPGFEAYGNIGGRPYINLSISATVLRAFGKNRKDTLQFLEGTLYSRIPEEMEIPLIPLSLKGKLSVVINFIKIQIKQNRVLRELPQYLVDNPAWCARMHEKIQATTNTTELHSLWYSDIGFNLEQGVWRVMTSVSHFANYVMKLRRQLNELVGPEKANTLISGFSNGGDLSNKSYLLASLGPVLGIAKVALEEEKLENYLAEYGHRGPNEFELSVPRPAEDPSWLDEQLDQFRKFPVDVDALLAKQREQFSTALNYFYTCYPRTARRMKRRIDQVAPRARLREAVRSEYVRERWVARTFALRAGKLTGLGDDIFFLTLEEVLNLLSGDKSAIKFIPARKDTHKKYLALPTYPSIIRGRFEPSRWADDPNRRNDIYDASSTPGVFNDSPTYNELVSGSAGSAGCVEGPVRRLDNPAQGHQLLKGEILVTAQTDIAWTPLFPRAAAIVTDVGAPLSHAAVVARELGIPAVVGCGNATTVLHTGDRVMVDGGKGIVIMRNKK